MKSHIVAIAVAFCLCATSRGVTIDQNWESRFVLSPGFSSETNAPNDEVMCMAFDAAGNLYAGGVFRTVGNINAPGVARYDGTNWHALGEGLPESYIENLAVVGTNVFVSGSFIRPASGITNLAQWNGTEWIALGSGLSEEGTTSTFIDDLAAGATNLFVAGRFDIAGGIAVTNLARWDGSQWHSMNYTPSDVPFSGFSWVPVVAVKDDELYICERTFDFGMGIRDTVRLKKWVAGNWSVQGEALTLTGTMPGFSSLAIVCVGTKVFVSGQFFINALSATNIVCWDGVSWSAVDHPFEANNEIWPITSDGTNLFVALHPPSEPETEARAY